jgi:DNA-directed RNA polymerase specialized sigma24 family protein
VFVLSKVYGFTHQEIKARTRLTQATVERRLTDALHCLSAILGRDISTYGKGVYAQRARK